MTNDEKDFIQLLDEEYNRYHEYMCNKYGKEFIEDLHRKMDEALEIAVRKQFDNFASVRDFKI